MYIKWYLWLLPALLLAVGIYFSTVPIADFLAVACFGLAGLLVVIYLLPLLHKYKPKLALSIAVGLILLIFFGLCLLTVTAARIADAQAGEGDREVSYILVLGAKVNGEAPSDNLQCRIDAAYAYLTAHPQTVAILSGGQGSDEVITEAQCMYMELIKRGISQERLWLEEQATSTWENITFALALIEEKTGCPTETIGVVTSEFHLYRAGLFASDCGVQMVGIPGETADKAEYVYYFLREIAGVWHYYLLGGLYNDRNEVCGLCLGANCQFIGHRFSFRLYRQGGAVGQGSL